MTNEELNEMLEKHKLWLADENGGKRAVPRYANLRDANLRDADLRYANLSHADLDYSCVPLWCGGLDVHIDDRQAIQLLYHLVRNVLYSKNTSDEVKSILSNEEIIALANKFHRVGECGEIKQEVKN